MMYKAFEYFKNAQDLCNNSECSPYIKDIIRDLLVEPLVCESTIRHLLYKKNWVSDSKPKIVISAHNNQRGNLVVRWYPGSKTKKNFCYRADNFCSENEHGFDPIFVSECSVSEAILSGRPLNELMWIKKFRYIQSASSQVDGRILEQIAIGIKREYDGMISFLNENVDVLQATKIDIEYFNGQFSGLELIDDYCR